MWHFDMIKSFFNWSQNQLFNSSSFTHSTSHAFEQQCTKLKKKIQKLMKKKDNCISKSSKMTTQVIAKYFKIQVKLNQKNHELFRTFREDRRVVRTNLQIVQTNLQTLRKSHQNFEKSHQDLNKIVSLILSKDFIKRIVSWKHQLVEIVKKRFVWIVIERRKNSNDVLRKVVEDDDYETHEEDSILDKTSFFQEHLEWISHLLSYLDANDQSRSNESFQKTLCFISLKNYNDKLFFAISIWDICDSSLHNDVFKSSWANRSISQTCVL